MLVIRAVAFRFVICALQTTSCSFYWQKKKENGFCKVEISSFRLKVLKLG